MTKIRDGFPTHDRKGNPVITSGDMREVKSAADYCSRYRPGMPKEDVLMYYRWAADPDMKKRFEEKTDWQLVYEDYWGIESFDRRRED